MSDANQAGGRRARLVAWLKTPAALAVLGSVAVVVAVGASMLVHCPTGVDSCRLAVNHTGSTGDTRYFAALWEATRVTITEFRQFPSWNPYHCGGIVLYQDPQAPFPGPFFLLTFFWLPTAVAMKVWIFAHLLIGALGARALVRDRGGNPAEQVFGAAVMAASGFVAQHTGGGHLSFTPFLFLPFILWSFRRALVDIRYVVITAGLFALADIEGGTYPVPLMAVAILIESVARLGSPADRRGLALALPALGVLFVLLAGVRLVPVLHYLREHPRAVPLDDQITIGEVFRFWTTREHTRAVPGHPYVWPEYDAYVGIVPVLLMLVGVAIAVFTREDGVGTRRDRRIDLALLLGLVWCALGNIPGVSLFGLLHELPIYGSLRVPSRFLGPATVALGLLAVSALLAARDRLKEHGAGRRLMRGIVIGEGLIVAAIAADICLTNQRVMQQGLDPVLSRASAGAAFFQNTTADYGQFPSFPVRGYGTRSCYVPLEWKPAEGIVDGPGPQASLRPPEAGSAAALSWSPNVIELDVRLQKEAVVVVNQNYESGWQASAGTVGAFVHREGRFWDVRAQPGTLPPKGAIGLLAVRLPAGEHDLVLRHRPRGLALGALLTAAGVALAFLLVRYGTPRRVFAFRRRLHEWIFGRQGPG